MNEKSLEKIRRIRFVTMWMAIGIIAIVGLFFLTMADLKLGIESKWLFVAAITTLGSAVCVILSEMFKENKLVCVILKASSVVLSAIFIVVLIMFGPAYVDSVLEEKLVNTESLAKEQLEIRKNNALMEAHADLDWLLFVSYIGVGIALITQIVHFITCVFTVNDDK